MKIKMHIALLRKIGIVTACLFISFQGFGQDETLFPANPHKGKLYIFWGWNWDKFSKSDLHYTGDQYDFNLKDVEAHDKPKAFSLGAYFNPGVATIPQYNFRIGYFFKDNYSVSFGTDHMKYVVVPDQTVPISGYINGSGTEYDGVYNNEDIVLARDFLQLEHTDGLNYVNADIRRFDELFDFGKVQINLTEGVGAGLLYPRTNSKLLGNDRYDEFHVAGYGFSGVVALNLTFFRNFFIQSEFKTGYINMPDIRTTMSTADKASQDFVFYQINFVFGATLQLGKATVAK